MSSSIRIRRDGIVFEPAEVEAVAEKLGLQLMNQSPRSEFEYYKEVEGALMTLSRGVAVCFRPQDITCEVPFMNMLSHCADLGLKLLKEFPGSTFSTSPELVPYLEGGDQPLGPDYFMTYRKFVAPEDLNAADRLFGGRIMQWADEAVALYAMCQMKTKSIVTLKVSEILFKNPGFKGDIMEFYVRNKKVGKTSLQIECVVKRKTIPQPPIELHTVILSCDFTFVSINEHGAPQPHGMPV